MIEKQGKPKALQQQRDALYSWWSCVARDAAKAQIDDRAREQSVIMVANSDAFFAFKHLTELGKPISLSLFEPENFVAQVRFSYLVLCSQASSIGVTH